MAVSVLLHSAMLTWLLHVVLCCQAGGKIVSGIGQVTSPHKGWHHALQGSCDCILSEFKPGLDEDQQVSPLTTTYTSVHAHESRSGGFVDAVCVCGYGISTGLTMVVSSFVTGTAGAQISTAAQSGCQGSSMGSHRL